MKFFKTILPLLLITPSLAYFDVVNHWSKSDLEGYLKDNSISFNQESTLEELKDLASKRWNEVQYHASQEPWYDYGHVRQKALNLYEGRPLNAPPKGSASDYYNTVKDWVFNTWTESDLKNLLRKSKIKYHATATHDELVNLAKDNYDSIASNANASGRYLGDWLYDSWDIDDLKSWLDEYKIGYDSVKDSKDALTKKVRENAYEASKYTEEERESILDNLDLTAQSLFDKAGKIRSDVFNTWSASQLYRWIKNHQIKIDQSIKNNKEELALIAQKHKDKFHKDVEDWTSKASKSASPLLSKATDGVDNLINDTFLVGVENWSRDRLKSFLEARGIKPSFFTTKKELVELVNQNKYKPIQNFNAETFFDGWSKANIQKWISEQSSALSDDASDLVEQSNELYKNFLDTVGYYTSQAGDALTSAQQAVQDSAADFHKDAQDQFNKVTKDTANAVNQAAANAKSVKDQFFDFWSDSDLENYLSSFGIKPKPSSKHYSRDDLIKLAKQNTRWFLAGDDYGSKPKADLKCKVEELYNRAQKQLKELVDTLYAAVGV